MLIIHYKDTSFSKLGIPLLRQPNTHVGVTSSPYRVQSGAPRPETSATAVATVTAVVHCSPLTKESHGSIKLREVNL